MLRRLIAPCAAALLVTGGVTVAQQPDRDRTESLSRRAADRLQALHEEADRLATEERTLLGDLRRLEVERDIRTTEFVRARSEAQAAAAELDRLDQQVAALAAESTAALPDLRARIETLYKLGRGRYARLLLSASDMRQLGQAVRLVSALAEQDRQRVGQHRQRLAALEAARSDARDRKERLRQLEAAAEKARSAAEAAVAARTALVHDIDTRRDLNAQYSGELLAAQQRLQASLAGLAPAEPGILPITPFKGDLIWPVGGDVRQRFGAGLSGRPPLRGIEIETAEGAAVHAVHDGSVAFADTFSGYGRLVILEHGNQTFTLYGNLDDIRVQKGARVGRGDQVGTVGLGSGGTGVLYFELRVDGRAVDPLQWLANR